MSSAVAADHGFIDVSDLIIHYEDYLAVKGISFNAGAGEHLTLLGPSGCGKTTTLRSIAGLERPSAGEIVIDGKRLYSGKGRVNVPAERRGVSMVFQSYAIWPHMTVFDNVAYGLRVRKLPRQEVERAVLHALELVQMQSYASRSASMLSGGQQQRIALARAIAFSPKVVLFDEPLSNLDAKLRNAMRVELRDLQSRLQITSLYVTHDQEEALAISDRIIIMNSGTIEQIGTPQDIYDRPRNRFVADFIGSANLLRGSVEGRSEEGGYCFRTEGGDLLPCVAPYGVQGNEAEVAIRPAYIQLRNPEAGGAIMQGTVRRRMFHGDFIQYQVQCRSGEMTVRRSPTEVFEEGSNVALCFHSAQCVLLGSQAA